MFWFFQKEICLERVRKVENSVKVAHIHHGASDTRVSSKAKGVLLVVQIPTYVSMNPPQRGCSISQDNYARRGVGKKLKAIFDEMDSKKDGKIDVHELSSFLTLRQYPHTRHEAETMIWEVDEDDDGKVSWEEFERSYHRCVNDRLAMREPRQLHNIVLFALHAGPQANSMSIQGLSSYVYFEHGSVSARFLFCKQKNASSILASILLKEFLLNEIQAQ